jgi:hypothetical protein
LGGTARSGTDFATLSGRVTIPVGSSAARITINPLDDTSVEGPETVVLTLSASSAYVVGSPRSATVTIADNDSALVRPTVTVVDSDGNAAESGANSGSFRIKRTGSTGAALTVRYSVSGSAVNGADYATLSGSVKIPAGSASATVLVKLINDGRVEDDENVVLTLAADAAYVIGSPSRAAVDIEDDD